MGLRGKHEPEIAAEELIAHRAQDPAGFAGWVREQTGLTARQVERGLDTPLEAQARALLLAAVDNDERLAVEIEPYLGLLRVDHRGLPQVWPPGSVYVTAGAERRSTGTYYPEVAGRGDGPAHAGAAGVRAGAGIGRPARGLAAEARRRVARSAGL